MKPTIVSKSIKNAKNQHVLDLSYYYRENVGKARKGDSFDLSKFL